MTTLPTSHGRHEENPIAPPLNSNLFFPLRKSPRTPHSVACGTRTDYNRTPSRVPGAGEPGVPGSPSQASQEGNPGTPTYVGTPTVCRWPPFVQELSTLAKNPQKLVESSKYTYIAVKHNIVTYPTTLPKSITANTSYYDCILN